MLKALLPDRPEVENLERFLERLLDTRGEEVEFVVLFGSWDDSLRSGGLCRHAGGVSPMASRGRGDPFGLRPENQGELEPHAGTTNGG